jgi:hypothetical protein
LKSYFGFGTMNRLFSLLYILSLVTSVFAGCMGVGGKESDTTSSVVINQVGLIYQHKDSTMVCLQCPASEQGSHTWNHAAGLDGIYGNTDDCPHCSTYCAPASIAMIATAYGKTGNYIKQDHIYEFAEQTSGTPGNGIIDSHGVGMFDGSGGQLQEVQMALDWALDGITSDQHDSVTPLDWTMLRDYILMDRPVLWLDHGGWPANQNDSYPPSENRQDQGHAKVIAGYDDRDTAGETDDLCLIYDPWPEYNDKSLLPTNATKGPQNTFDPYWLPLSDVLGDFSDIFLVPTDPIQ